MDFTAKFTQLQQYFSHNKTRDLAWRKQQLQQIKRLVVDNESAFLSALATDLGKPAQEAWMTETSYVASDVDHTCKRLHRWAKKRSVSTPLVAQPGRSYIQPEPQGTVLIIGAWNYPLQLILAPLVAVIAAGNCALVKPSELAPTTSALLAKLIPQYLDKNAVSVVEGGADETTALLALPFDHIMYTGNGQVARIVMAAAAKHLTPVTLELGGKSPVYVDDSADLNITAQRIAWGKWMNAGQTCIAPDYILCSKRLVTPLTTALKAQIINMFGQEPKQSKSYGRIVNQRHTKRISDYLADQDIAVGGEFDLENRYIAPTIVINPARDSSLMSEEIFGPILPIIAIEDFAQAKAFVTMRDKPLAAYIFSKNKHQCQAWVHDVRAGNQGINDVIMFNAVPELPFGGVGPSGIGQYSGQAGFDNFSHLKSVLARPFIKDLPIRFAPYGKIKFKILRWLR
ncbi:aldehyde dehydrogenase (NAD+) [Colwellia chukchiensis]|uniref:Aldehyde dehydrogenase n=1 Tax=Colwellia chukchiensis TaxID=641665 RepID=A0A1H7LYN4_9GAMM|nr:aldehyde dehydrogenase family protein [Colwellia chukchiensis]SEL04044.1 aldehyde dehydrogenase (NAD+) [Colwellia chukchiensis]